MGVKIDGKAISKELRKYLKTEVEELKKADITPKLTVLLVGDNAASKVYVKNKEKAAAKIGIESVVKRLSESISEEALLQKIDSLNSDTTNHGILVQLPLPHHINAGKILLAINPEKDVDGFHPVNIGKLVIGGECLKPCTPSGIIHLIESTGIDIAGKNAVVVGRSNIVGKPVAIMLLEKNATVTICHSKTKDLPYQVGRADILVAAIGKSEIIKGEWIKKGAIVIDVGTNMDVDGKLKGDVEYDSAIERAAFITPVPGGVGPMTIAMLMKNTIEAAKNVRGAR